MRTMELIEEFRRKMEAHYREVATKQGPDGKERVFVAGCLQKIADMETIWCGGRIVPQVDPLWDSPAILPYGYDLDPDDD